MYSWQDIVALLLVTLAAASLLHRGWRVFFKRTRGCGGCSACPASSPRRGRPREVVALHDERLEAFR